MVSDSQGTRGANDLNIMRDGSYSHIHYLHSITRRPTPYVKQGLYKSRAKLSWVILPV